MPAVFAVGVEYALSLIYSSGGFNTPALCVKVVDFSNAGRFKSNGTSFSRIYQSPCIASLMTLNLLYPHYDRIFYRKRNFAPSSICNLPSLSYVVDMINAFAKKLHNFESTYSTCRKIYICQLPIKAHSNFPLSQIRYLFVHIPSTIKSKPTP